jgi:hypothetical protein
MRHDDVDFLAENPAQLADALVVGAVAAPDGQRRLIEPDDVTPFDFPLAGDGAGQRDPELAKGLCLGRRLRRAGCLAHVAQDHPPARGDGGVAHIQGVEPGDLVARHPVDAGSRFLDQRREAVVLGGGAAGIGRRQIVQPAPRGLHRRRVAKGIACVLQQDALQRADVGRRRTAHASPRARRFISP